MENKTHPQTDPPIHDGHGSPSASPELLDFWKREGVFDTPWPQYDDIGPGKRFADSTEYVQHLRRQTTPRGK